MPKHTESITNSLRQCHHRLNGSSSPVLTASSLSYGKAKNSTPHRIKTPDPIEIKFGRVDYVGEGTRHTKFYANPSKGGFPANGSNIRKNFCSCTYTFFRKLTYRSDPSANFCTLDGSNDAATKFGIKWAITRLV